MDSRKGWDLYHLKGCTTHINSKSKDTSRKIGCIITGKANQILMTGFNGFPIGIQDDIKLVPERYEGLARYENTIHAEMSAILLSARTGVALEDATLYCSLCPCHPCALAIIHAGIKRVVSIEPPITEHDKRYSFDESLNKFNEAKVEVTLYSGKELEEYINEA